MGRFEMIFLALSTVLVSVLGCDESREPTRPLPEGGGSFQVGGRPFQWDFTEALFCPRPTTDFNAQLQSIFPLNERGTLILIGRNGCWFSAGDVQDYQVFDISSGEAVLQASVATDGEGINIAAHSPSGSTVGFGGEGTRLVVYDGSFEVFTVPCPDDCDVWDVWASSPTDVWVATVGEVGRIYHFDRENFTLEHQGGQLSGLWGFGGPRPTTIYALGDRIMEREIDGTWTEVVSPTDMPVACAAPGLPAPIFRVAGLNPADVWAAAVGDCIMHFDGQNWVEMPIPDNAGVLGGIWPLTRNDIFVSGQGGVDLNEGRIALWRSLDGGQSWTQIVDPVFAGLPRDRRNQDASFFDIVATWRGEILAPSIGGTLIIGSAGPPGAGPNFVVSTALAATGADGSNASGSSMASIIQLER